MEPRRPAQEDGIARDRRFKEAVRREWSSDAIVSGWRRWYRPFAAQSRATTELLAEAAGIQPGDHVLDLASGPGDPAIALAARVGPDGHVTATDISAGMVAAAEANASSEGRSNMSFRQADMEALPFAGGRFDRVTCRFGIMFCPDVQRALAEALRVLRPGGIGAFVVWGPPFEQGFVSTTMAICSEYTSLPECEIGAPNAFSFAQTGKLTALMQQVGFQVTEEERRAIAMSWEGPPEEYWQYVHDTATPVREVLAKMEAEGNASAVPELVERLTDAYRQFYDGRWIRFPAVVNVAVGRRPRP